MSSSWRRANLRGRNPIAARGRRQCTFALRRGARHVAVADLPGLLSRRAEPAVKPDPNLPSSYTSTLFTNDGFVNPLAVNNPNPFAPASASTSGTATAYMPPLRAAPTPWRRACRPTSSSPIRGCKVAPTSPAMADTRATTLCRSICAAACRKDCWCRPITNSPKPSSSQRVSFRAPRVNALDDNTLRHAFKVNWVYELPIGRGKALLGNVGGWLDRLVGGWEFHGSGRVQSGQLFDFGNVNLVGMTMKDLQKAFKLRFDDAKGIVYILPQDIIDNTIQAFNVSATSATGYGARGAPTGRYIAPANGPNCIQVYHGQCAPQNVFVTGPKFTRFDLSLKKQIKINERFNFELRAEFLNAFNNINFFNPPPTAMTTFSNANFMQVTTAYPDPSNTQDPGGRLVQIVARFNF